MAAQNFTMPGQQCTAPWFSPERLLTAVYVLLSMKYLAIVAVFGVFLVAALAFFVIILDALIELCSHVAQVWNGSTPIERLLILLLVWFFCYKMYPFVARLLKSNALFLLRK